MKAENNAVIWTRYSVAQPREAGLYEWRIPSKAVPGAVLVVAAKMRLRGAGYENVISPEFDYWDGYRLHVKCEVEWRPTHLVLAKNERTPAVLYVEGLDLSPCSHCGKVPRIEAHQRPASGGIVCLPAPWNLNSWRFICCAWGSTPELSDPREIERIRHATRGKAAPDLLEALIAAEKALNNIRACCMHTGWDATGPAVEQARAAIAKARGSEE